MLSLRDNVTIVPFQNVLTFSIFGSKPLDIFIMASSDQIVSKLQFFDLSFFISSAVKCKPLPCPEE